MIVIDENIHDQRILTAISAWYPGQVVSITALRPRSVIKDDAIASLLQHTFQPTFITINVADFWKRAAPHKSYCIVAVELPKERSLEIPDLVQRLFRLPEFRAKAMHMGKIVRVAPRRIEYYESDRRVHSVTFSE